MITRLAISVNVGRIEYGLTGTDLARIRKAQANASVRVLMDHFAARGGRRYWGTAAKSTTAEVTGDEVLLHVKHPGVRLHWLGGHVSPGRNISSKTGGPTKALSIPEDDQIDRVAPGGYKGLLAYVGARGPKLIGMLVDAERRPLKKGRNKGKMKIMPARGGLIRYWLVSGTDHDPDPSVVPLDAIAEAAASATRQYINLISKLK